jgi:hypothetical protein
VVSPEIYFGVFFRLAVVGTPALSEAKGTTLFRRPGDAIHTPAMRTIGGTQYDRVIARPDLSGRDNLKFSFEFCALVI